MNGYYLHPTSIVEDHVQIGSGTKIWCFSHIQQGASIGQNCSLGQNVNISDNVQIGNHVKIQNNVSIYEGVEIEDNVFCGPSSVFTNDYTPRAKYPKGKENYVRTLVKHDATIGANATIVCGITLGEYCFIGAGAVVISNVPSYAVMLGVPAKQRGWACRCGKKLIKDGNVYICNDCGMKFKKKTMKNQDGLAAIDEIR